MHLVISKRLDCRWLYDHEYIFHLRKTLKQMKSGEILEFITNDDGCELDLKAWSKLTGHPVLEIRNRDDHYKFYIQKKHQEVFMAEFTINATLDCRGMLCPMPVVKTNKAIKSMQVGEVLEMISTDPGAIPDMQAWAKQTGHELLEAKEENSEYRFVIRKTH